MKAYLREDTYVEDWPEINFEGEYTAEVDPRPNHTKMLNMIDDGIIDCCDLAKDLLAWLPDDEVGEFMRVYDLSEGLEENPEDAAAVEEGCKGAECTEGEAVKECGNGYKKPLHEETAAQAKTLQAIIKMIDSKYIDDITATLKKAADDAANLSADDIETWVYDGVIGFVAPYFDKYHQLPVFKDGTVFVNEDAEDVRDLDYDTFASQYSSTFDFLDLADDYIWFNNEFKNDYDDEEMDDLEEEVTDKLSELARIGLDKDEHYDAKALEDDFAEQYPEVYDKWISVFNATEQYDQLDVILDDIRSGFDDYED